MSEFMCDTSLLPGREDHLRERLRRARESEQRLRRELGAIVSEIEQTCLQLIDLQYERDQRAAHGDQ
jgi:hypothetical protein